MSSTAFYQGSLEEQEASLALAAYVMRLTVVHQSHYLAAALSVALAAEIKVD